MRDPSAVRIMPMLSLRNAAGACDFYRRAGSATRSGITGCRAGPRSAGHLGASLTVRQRIARFGRRIGRGGPARVDSLRVRQQFGLDCRTGVDSGSR